MNSLRNLSNLTKANVAVIILFAIGSFLGQFVIWDLYVLMPYAFALLVGQSITTALNDPEAEEPVPLALRAAVGYGVGILFGVGLMMVNSFITSNLQYLRLNVGQ